MVNVLAQSTSRAGLTSEPLAGAAPAPATTQSRSPPTPPPQPVAAVQRPPESLKVPVKEPSQLPPGAAHPDVLLGFAPPASEPLTPRSLTIEDQIRTFGERLSETSRQIVYWIAWTAAWLLIAACELMLYGVALSFLPCICAGGWIGVKYLEPACKALADYDRKSRVLEGIREKLTLSKRVECEVCPLCLEVRSWSTAI